MRCRQISSIKWGIKLRELSYYAAFTQEITRYGVVGMRYEVYDPNSDILETYKERIRREWNMPVAAYCDMMRVVTPGDICMGGAIKLSAFVQMFPKLHIVAYVWSPGSNTTAATGTFCAVQAYISPLQANYTARLLWLDEKTPHFDWLDTFDPFITPRHPPARTPVANKSPPLPTTKLTPGVSLGV